ncbi:MAG: hypothetical protein V3T77_03470 [Planctomycetota bacterium]
MLCCAALLLVLAVPTLRERVLHPVTLITATPNNSGGLSWHLTQEKRFPWIPGPQSTLLPCSESTVRHLQPRFARILRMGPPKSRVLPVAEFDLSKWQRRLKPGQTLLIWLK